MCITQTKWIDVVGIYAPTLLALGRILVSACPYKFYCLGVSETLLGFMLFCVPSQKESVQSTPWQSEVFEEPV